MSCEVPCCMANEESQPHYAFPDIIYIFISADTWNLFPLIMLCIASSVHVEAAWYQHIDGLVQEGCNSSVFAMELCLSCTDPSIWNGSFFPPVYCMVMYMSWHTNHWHFAPTVTYSLMAKPKTDNSRVKKIFSDIWSFCYPAVLYTRVNK